MFKLSFAFFFGIYAACVVIGANEQSEEKGFQDISIRILCILLFSTASHMLTERLNSFIANPPMRISPNPLSPFIYKQVQKMWCM